jgi:hypothetical protein
VKDVMRADLWLWHESELEHAVHLLSYCRFRLILLDSTFGRRLSTRSLVRRITRLAHDTPVVLRVTPEELPENPDPRVYGVTAVVQRGVGGPTERAMRQLLGLV